MNDIVSDSFKRSRIIIALNIIVMILSIITILGLYSYTRLEKQAMLGQMYSEDVDMSKAAINNILNVDINKTNLNNGVEAFKVAGYTENAFSYLPINAIYNLILIIFGVVITIIMILLLISYRRLPIFSLIKKNAEQKNTIDKLRNDIKNKTDYLTKKNRQLQDFTENISHQIKTPLAGLSLSLDIIKDKDPENDLVDDCFIQIDRIQNFITRLLKISRLESGKTVFIYNEINLANCIKNAAELGETRNCKFEFQMDKQCIVSGDEEWLMEAFINIYNNCAGHTYKNGLVKTEIHQYPESVQITISDNGEGIPEEGLPYIFDRFITMKNSGQSHNGIGLNLSKLIIEKHKGSIAAFNNDDKGATFVISLPKFMLKSGKRISDKL